MSAESEAIAGKNALRAPRKHISAERTSAKPIWQRILSAMPHVQTFSDSRHTSTVYGGSPTFRRG